MLRAAKDGAPPAYDAGDEAAYHAAPAPSEPAPPPGRRAARAAAAEYDSIKPPPAATLDLRRLGSVLTRLGEHELLRTLRALRRPDTFRAEFLAEPGAVQQGPRRRTVMAPHLWGQLCSAGVVEPAPRLARGAFTCALRLVPDRKAERRARVIFPVCALNDACRRPPPTPTPRLHDLIADVLTRDWAVTADLRGWFFSLEVPRAVAARYFGLIGPSGPAVARRGLLGWSHMPSMMARIALAMSAQAERRCATPATPHSPSGGRALTRRVWIDNYVIGGDGPDELRRFMRQLRAVTTHLRAELHEEVAPSRRVVAVGVELDLRAKRWRLNPAFPPKFTAMATGVDSKRRLPVITVWRAVGSAVWTAFALALPLVWVEAALRYVASLAARFQAGSITADTIVPYPRAVRDAVRAAATQACRNPWRAFTVGVSRPVWSDASGGGGCGAVVPTLRGYTEVAWRDDPAAHINILEARAALGALLLSAPPLKRSAVPIIIDNSCAAYQLLRGRGRPDAANLAIRAAYEWAARHAVGLQPRLVPSADQPADVPSRADAPYARPSVAPPPDSLGASLCTRPPPIAFLPVGWRRSVTKREFVREACRALRPLLPRASPSP